MIAPFSFRDVVTGTGGDISCPARTWLVPFLLHLATGQHLYQLQWTFDDSRKMITFNVVVHTTGWVGFGLSPRRRDGGLRCGDWMGLQRWQYLFPCGLQLGDNRPYRLFPEWQYGRNQQRRSVSLNLLGGLVNPPPQSSNAENFTIAVNQIFDPEQRLAIRSFVEGNDVSSPCHWASGI
eukprot:Em0005g716a